MRRQTLALILAGCGVAGCNAILGIQDHAVESDASTDSGGSSSGSTAESGADTGESEAESGTVDSGEPSDGPTCTGSTLYVSSSTGSDSNPGCSSGAPKKTIGSALAAGKASGTVTAIHVCKGTYSESPLTLGFPASLLGGYDCTTWSRTAAYGYPTFDGADLTTIESASASTSSSTLTIEGVALTTAVVIDGFTIVGATTGTSTTHVSAVTFQNSTLATLSNNQVIGGGLPATASFGVGIFTSANPTIKNNKIDGGSGVVSSTTSIASVGIYADPGSAGAQILSNVINGGRGTNTGPGSAALYLLGNGSPVPVYFVQANVITAGTGTSTLDFSAEGIYVSGTANVTVDSNSIDGGAASGSGLCGDGVDVLSASVFRLTRNRIYAGTCGVSGLSPLYGVSLSGVEAPAIYNNMIHAGTSTTSPGSAALVLQASVDAADVRHNTFIGGPVPGGTLGTGVLLRGSGATFANNIVAGSGTNNTGVTVGSCPDAGAPLLQAFENNLIFGVPSSLVGTQGCSGTQFKTIDSLTAGLPAVEPGVAVSGNVTVASSCTTGDGGSDSGCIVVPGCTSPQACLTTMFAGWDVGSLGYANLFPATPFTSGGCPIDLPPAGNGWTLSTVAPLPPCKVTRSSLNDTNSPGLGVDLYGNCRASSPSMGAEEDSAAGACL